MARSSSTIGDLLAMSLPDLETEIRKHSVTVAKMRLDIELRKEKDTARYRRERRHLAVLETAAAKKRSESLHEAKTSSTVPARANGTPSKGASRGSARP